MLIELLRRRRSIRKFTDKDVEPDKIEVLLEAALRSPSSRNINPWEFIVVRDRESIVDLSQAKDHGSAFLRRAPLAIVVCADPAKSDVWIEDASIAALLLHLTAADLGLGSCWIQIRGRRHDEKLGSEEYVKRLLGIAPGLAVEAIVAVGYPAEQKPGHPASSLPAGRVSYERFGRGD